MNTANYSHCPYCNKSLSGFLGANLISQDKIDYINRYTDAGAKAYCSSCSGDLLGKLEDAFKKQKTEIETRLQQIIHFIPVITSPPPVKWEYDLIGMVSAQTTSGTGFATELSRSFNDMFGTTSNATNQKIATATAWCKADLRAQCVRAGGNAIVSTDIDFNEIGSGSTNMLMVCMAGTAIRVDDVTNFTEKSRDRIVEVVELVTQLDAIPRMSN